MMCLLGLLLVTSARAVPCLSEADEDLRNTYKQRAVGHESAKRQCRSNKENFSPEHQKGFGLCGIGDMQAPIQIDLFKACSQRGGFVKSLAQDWVKSHSMSVASDAVEPIDCKQHMVCSDFCMTCGLYGVNRALYASAKNLLIDITRGLKVMYNELKKRISQETKHPLLFARWLCPNSKREVVRAWLITFAAFRPYRLDSIELCLEEPLEFPCMVELGKSSVDNTTMESFQFSSTSRMAADIARLNPTQDPAHGSLQYCFNAAYRLTRTSLLTLVIPNAIEWVALGACEDEEINSESDGDGGDGDDPDEIDFISDLVSGLLGEHPDSSDSRQSYKKQTPSSSNNAGQAGRAKKKFDVKGA